MCMEDVNLARATRNNFYTASANSVRLPPNPDRISVRLRCNFSAVCKATLSLTSQSVVGITTPQDVVIGSLMTGVDLEVAQVCCMHDDITIERVGPAICGELELTETDGGRVFATEVYLPINDGQSLEINKLPS